MIRTQCFDDTLFVYKIGLTDFPCISCATLTHLHNTTYLYNIIYGYNVYACNFRPNVGDSVNSFNNYFKNDSQNNKGHDNGWVSTILIYIPLLLLLLLLLAIEPLIWASTCNWVYLGACTPRYYAVYCNTVVHTTARLAFCQKSLCK